MTDKKPVTVTVPLETPFKLGDNEVTELTLTKPKSGAMRGLKLTEIMQCDYNAHRTLLPRICQPVITESHVDDLDPADMAALSGEIVGFFISRSSMAAISEHLGMEAPKSTS